MGAHREPIPADRLIEAAIAVLKARVEFAGTHGGAYPDPVRLLGHADQPAVLCAFSRAEVSEAAAFLVRMGFIEPPVRPGKRAA